jgi:hypothetical protein
MPKLDDLARHVLLDSVVTRSRLGVLLLLFRERPRSFTARDVAARLPSKPRSLEEELAMLCGRGLLSVVMRSDLRYAYAPVNAELDRAVRDLANAWLVGPAEIDALLDARAHPVRAFASAFRLFDGADE